jgi:hypothetical protein
MAAGEIEFEEQVHFDLVAGFTMWATAADGTGVPTFRSLSCWRW